MAIKLNKDLFKSHDVCFAPNNHLVVSDIEDKPVKIFTLEGDQEQVNRFVIGYNATRSLIVQDVNAMKKELSSRIQLNLETVRVSHNIYTVGRSHYSSYLSYAVLIFLSTWTRINKVL